MLSPTDVHILVGLLIRIHESGDNVEVELGSMVDDALAEEARDVDITVTTTDKDGTRTAYVGTEVKREGRCLDVTKVEQLCAKLLHMPSLTRRAIVSASGYTAAAVLVAEKQGVDLYDLLPWDDVEVQFDTKLAPNLLKEERLLGWLQTPPPYCTFEVRNPPRRNPDLDERTKVFDRTGKRLAGATLAELSRNVARRVLEDLVQKEGIREIPDGTEFPVSEHAGFPDHPHVKIKGRLCELSGVHFTGIASWTSRAMTSVMKVLQPHGGPARQGVVLGETSAGALVGLVLSKASQRPTVIQIAVPDRIRDKIRRLSLTPTT